MRHIFLWSLLGCFFTQAPLYAQSLSATVPSENAKELARLVNPDSLVPPARSDKDWSRLAQETLYNHHIATDGADNEILASQPCDHSVPECENVEKEVAAKFIKDRKAFDQRVAQHFYALHFERTMSQDQISAGIKFLRTVEGKALASAMLSVLSKLTYLDLASNPVGQWDDAPYIKEFRQRTLNLPRDPMRGRITPPPPPPYPVR